MQLKSCSYAAHYIVDMKIRLLGNFQSSLSRPSKSQVTCIIEDTYMTIRYVLIHFSSRNINQVGWLMEHCLLGEFIDYNKR